MKKILIIGKRGFLGKNFIHVSGYGHWIEQSIKNVSGFEVHKGRPPGIDVSQFANGLG